MATVIDTDNADDLAVLANIPDSAESLQHTLVQAALGISPYTNSGKTEFMSFNLDGVPSSWNGKPLEITLIYISSNKSSTECSVNIRIGKVWNAIDRLSIM